MIVHENFDYDTATNDICLLELQEIGHVHKGNIVPLKGKCPTIFVPQVNAHGLTFLMFRELNWIYNERKVRQNSSKVIFTLICFVGNPKYVT